MITAYLLAATLVASPAPAAVNLSDLPNGQTILDAKRRDTCWRTNRSTGQKFRIC
jgi:hypothetical protein